MVKEGREATRVERKEARWVERKEVAVEMTEESTAEKREVETEVVTEEREEEAESVASAEDVAAEREGAITESSIHKSVDVEVAVRVVEGKEGTTCAPPFLLFFFLLPSFFRLPN